MKPAIHPNYQETSYTCACGNQVVIPSTHTKEVHVDICSNCHPLYTGKEKLIDTEGRIDKFRKKYAQKG